MARTARDARAAPSITGSQTRDSARRVTLHTGPGQRIAGGVPHSLHGGELVSELTKGGSRGVRHFATLRSSLSTCGQEVVVRRELGRGSRRVFGSTTTILLSARPLRTEPIRTPTRISIHQRNRRREADLTQPDWDGPPKEIAAMRGERGLEELSGLTWSAPSEFRGLLRACPVSVGGRV